MSREYGVSAAEGAAASVLVTLINTIVGFAVAIVAGASLLRLPPVLVVDHRADGGRRYSHRRRRCRGSALSGGEAVQPRDRAATARAPRASERRACSRAWRG